MSKHHQTKVRPTNRVATSISVDPETPSQENMNQIEGQMGSSQSKPEFTPSYEEIQKRAYQIHEEKGGSELENWLEAEQSFKVQ